MKERNLKISLETAKKWYNSKNEELVKLALEVFTHSELESSSLPKSWKEYKDKCFNGELNLELTKHQSNLDIFRKLLIIRDVYRQGWKPRFTMESGDKWEVTFFGEELTIECVSMYGGYFVFETKEIALEFLNNFKDELNKIKGLL